MSEAQQAGTAEAGNRRTPPPATPPPDKEPAGETDYFRSVFDHAPVGIYQSTQDRLIRVNPLLAKMFGYESAAEMIASTDHPANFFVRREARTELIRDALSSVDYVRKEVDFRRKDHSILSTMVRIRAVRDQSGEVQFFEGFVEDIGGLKEVEKQAAAALEYTQILLKSAP